MYFPAILYKREELIAGIQDNYMYNSYAKTFFHIYFLLISKSVDMSLYISRYIIFFQVLGGSLCDLLPP